MNYKITKKNEEVFVENDTHKLKLDFDFIKSFSKEILNMIVDGVSIKPIITCSSDLILYKDTLDNIYESIKTDKELIELYKKHNAVSNSDNNQEGINEEPKEVVQVSPDAIEDDLPF